jgi:hypothetical protein
MKRRSLVAFLSLVLLATAALHAADDASQPRWFVLHQEISRPFGLQTYEQTTKEFVGLLQQHRDLMPGFSFTAFAGTDLVYSYVSPIQSPADIAKVNEAFGAVAGAVGVEKWSDLMHRNGNVTAEIRESILMEDPSFSYAPAQPRLKQDEMRYYDFDLYYMIPGRDAEADAICREFAALFRKKQIPDGYRLFKVVLGSDMPMLVVVTGAKDPADFDAEDASVREALGPEGQALFQRAFAISRRFDRRGGWLRPDLSLPPVKPAGH